MKTIACKDLDMSCDFVASGDNENEVIKKMMDHADKSHMNEMKKMTETMDEKAIKEKMKSIIK